MSYIPRHPQSHSHLREIYLGLMTKPREAPQWAERLQVFRNTIECLKRDQANVEPSFWKDFGRDIEDVARGVHEEIGNKPLTPLQTQFRANLLEFQRVLVST